MFARFRFLSVVAFLAGFALSAAAQTDREWLEEGRSFLQLQKLRDAGCTACHDSTRRIVGPTWQEVAKRYSGNPAAPGMLADRVIKGSSGAWGSVPMPPSLKISRAEAEELLREVLGGGRVAANAATSAAAVGGGRRVALVIGNANYSTAPRLKSPINDAEAMEKRLLELGFEVHRRTDLNAAEMSNALREFSDRVSADTLALFHYSGHGMMIGGADHMVATDAGIDREANVKRAAIGVDMVLQSISKRNPRAAVAFFDMDRSSPFRQVERTGFDVPPNFLVGFATEQGQVATDGSDGRHGLFSEHLIRLLDTPGLPVADVLRKTRTAVRVASKEAQVPWGIESLKENIVLTRSAGPTIADAPRITPAAVVAAPSAKDTLKAIEARAEKGDVSAMKLLSKLYLSGGDGIEKSITKAHVWLIKAAREHEDDEAYFRLGELYESGQTVDGQIHIGAARGSYLNAANRGHREARAAYERLTTTAGTAREEAPQQAESSFSFGDFLRGVGKVIGAAGMVAGARYNDPGMIQQGAALIDGDANAFARAQAAQHARQQAAPQAQSSGRAGGGDCSQFARNRDIARRNAAVAGSSFTSERDLQLRVAQANENAYQACISQ